MTCEGIQTLQLGARGALIDFLFVTRNALTGEESPVDLTTATALEAYFRRPSGARTPALRVTLVVADALGGRARYVTEDGFLSEIGEWQAQGFVTFAGAPGSWIPSQVVSFRILANLRPFTFAPTLEPGATGLGVSAPAPTVS